MSREKMFTLAAQMKRELSKYVPEQNIEASATLYPDSDDEYLKFFIKLPEEYRTSGMGAAV